MRLVGRCASAPRSPARESRAIDMLEVARTGREAVPNRSTRADATKDSASAVSAPRGDKIASSSPPAPKPTIWADWATIRISERPRT